MNSTPGPVSMTSPVISWPRIRPAGAVVRPRTMCWSDAADVGGHDLQDHAVRQRTADVVGMHAGAVLQLQRREVDVLDLDLAGFDVGDAAVLGHGEAPPGVANALPLAVRRPMAVYAPACAWASAPWTSVRTTRSSSSSDRDVGRAAGAQHAELGPAQQPRRRGRRRRARPRPATRRSRRGCAPPRPSSARCRPAARRSARARPSRTSTSRRPRR